MRNFILVVLIASALIIPSLTPSPALADPTCIKITESQFSESGSLTECEDSDGSTTYIDEEEDLNIHVYARVTVGPKRSDDSCTIDALADATKKNLLMEWSYSVAILIDDETIFREGESTTTNMGASLAYDGSIYSDENFTSIATGSFFAGTDYFFRDAQVKVTCDGLVT